MGRLKLCYLDFGGVTTSLTKEFNGDVGPSWELLNQMVVWDLGISRVLIKSCLQNNDGDLFKSLLLW